MGAALPAPRDRARAVWRQTEPGSVESSACRHFRERTQLDARGVRADARHNAAGELERGPARLSADARRAPRAYRIHKVLEFRLERLDVLRRQLVKGKLRLRPGTRHAHAQGVAPRVIERDILVLL